MLTRNVLPVLNLPYNNVFSSFLTAIPSERRQVSSLSSLIDFHFSCLIMVLFVLLYELIRSWDLSSLSWQKVISMSLFNERTWGRWVEDACQHLSSWFFIIIWTTDNYNTVIFFSFASEKCVALCEVVK